MRNIDSAAMMNVARKIFHATRSKTPDTFQDWALEQLKTLIPFDHCKWGSGIIQNEQVTIHAVHLHNFPNDGMFDYLQHQPQDRILASMIAARSQVTTFDRYDITPRDIFIQQPIYQNYCQKNGLEQLISTMVPEPISNLYSVISLSRSDYNKPFSADEKKIKTILTPMLTEARNHNIFIHMIQVDNKRGQFAAISDPRGLLREAEPIFSKLMLEEWPEWEGPQLNFDPGKILNQNKTAHLDGEKISIHISAIHELILLQAHKKSVLDTLSTAEKNVTMLLLQGYADKEIARTLGISPKTVGHHLQHIYKKTNLPNRKQVIAQLKHRA